MDKKKVVIIAAIVCAVAFCAFEFSNKKSDSNYLNINKELKTSNSQESVSGKTEFNNNKNSQTQAVIEKKYSGHIEADDNYIKKTDLYNEAPSSALPLSAITEISDLPVNIQGAVSKISENNNIYLINRFSDKLIVISEHPENIRHSVEFTEISLLNGHQKQTTLGYNDKMKDSDNDIWEYNSAQQPIRHTKYNSAGDMEFVETWNYDSDNPVKYEMKDSEGNVISMRKEVTQDGSDLRVEHLVYDKEGNTKMSATAVYDGQDIKHFTYYNSDKPEEGGSVFSEYSDGLKTKEVVYTNDLKVKNSYTADYKDGVRTEIIKWSNENKEVEKLLPKD